MDAGDFNLVTRGSFTNPVPLRRRNLGNRISQGERRDLHTAISQFRGERKNVLNFPVAEYFVANRKLHVELDVGHGAASRYYNSAGRQIALIFWHVMIDFVGPGVDAAFDALEIFEALLPEKF